MEKKIIQALNKPIYPYLFGIFFVVYRTSLYFPFFNVFIFLSLLIAHFIICFSISKISKIVFGYENCNLSLLLTLILLYNSTFLINEISTIFPFLWIRNRYYLVIIVIVYFVLSSIESRKLKDRNILKGAIILNSFLIISCIISIGAVFFNEYRKPNQNNKNKYTTIAKKTGIVWILMDEYPNSICLLNQFDYKNSLDSFLISRKFYVFKEIYSRSSSTLASLNSIFNYDDTTKYQNFMEVAGELQKSKWINSLSLNKYSLNLYDFLTVGSKKSVYNLYIYPVDYLGQILSPTIFYKILGSVFDVTDRYNQYIINELEESQNKKNDSATFSWYHVMIPHQPYFRDEVGHFQKVNLVNPNSSQKVKPLFLNYLKYGNTIIEKIIISHSDFKDKIVIISGDHGVRFPFIDPSEYTKPYCAIYMPQAYDTLGLKKIKYISQLPDFLMKYLSGN